MEEETLSALRPSLVSDPGQTQMKMQTPGSQPRTAASLGVTEETIYIDTTVRRKVPLRWPPSSMSATARMPWFSITVSEDGGEERDTKTGSPSDDPETPEQGIKKSRNKTSSTTPTASQRETTANTQPHPLLAQTTEMARLLRRAYVKYCLPRELGSQDQLDTEAKGAEAADIRSLVRAGDKIVEERVLKDLMAPADEDESLRSSSNSKAGGRGGRRRKRQNPSEQGDGQEAEEEEEEKTLREHIAVVRRLAREKVGFEVVPPYRERDRLDGKEWYNQVGDHAWDEAIDTEEAIEEMEMDDLEEVGRWMGRVLRR